MSKLRLMRWLVLCVCLVCLFDVHDAQASRGRYNRQYAVPAPGTVVIDGDLSEWDRSAEIEFFVVPETRESQAVKISVMFDEQALYLGGIVRDNSPMMNRHEPNASGDKGWDADSIQFRLVTDASAGYPLQETVWKYRLKNPDGKPYTRAQMQAMDQRDDVVHLTMWHYTDKQLPVLQMYKGLTYRSANKAWEPFGIVPQDQFQGHYRKLDDGLGYIFEYRIPWSTMGAAKPLKAGDVVAATVQASWSRPDGLKTAGGSAWAYDNLSKAGFPFQDGTTWGKLIFLDHGNVSSELVDAGLPPEKPLPLSFRYDMPVDGEVTVQLFDADNNVLRTLVAQGKRNGGVNIEKWDGMDSTGVPLQPGEYHWQGNYTQKPVELKYRFSVHNSGQPAYPTPNDKGGWGADHGVPTTVCPIPGTSDMLLSWSVAEFGWGIIRVDAKGRKKWGSKHSASHIASDGKRFFSIDQHGFHSASGIKVFDVKDSRPLSFAGASYAGLPTAGDEQQDEMTGLAVGDGKLFVSYAHRNLVAIFDATDARLIKTLDVERPASLAYAGHGELLVVSGTSIQKIQDGKVMSFVTTHMDDPHGIALHPDGRLLVANRGKLMNVSVFDKSGQFIQSIGRDGGRNAIGTYQADGLYMPEGIALDGSGRLWVAEHADSPKRHSVWDIDSAKNVDEFFGGSSYFGYCAIDPAKPDEIYAHNTLWKINWDNYTTTPVSTIWRQVNPNDMMSILPDGYHGQIRVFTREDGKQFAFGNGDNSWILSMRVGDIYRPVMSLFMVRRGKYGYRQEQFELLKDQDRYPNGNYFWQDANDDGQVQATEVSKVSFEYHAMRPKDIDQKSMSIWLLGGYVLNPVRFNDGCPAYDATQFEKSFLYGTQQAKGYIWLDPDGSVYTLKHGDHDYGWTKWSTDGKPLVNYPSLAHWQKALGYPVQKPGRLWGMTGPLGIAGDFTGNATYFGMSHIFDRNGHYVAGLGYDDRVGGDPALAGQPEGQGGGLVKLNIKGEQRYFFLQGGQDSRVMEVMNLDSIKPLPGGRFMLTQEDVQLAADAQEQYKLAIARSGGLTIVRGAGALATARSVGKTLEGGRAFEATMAYDDQNLYVRYVVATDHPLVNAQPDPRLIFKGGNLLDIQLGTQPDAPADREKPAAGDVRLLVSRDASNRTRAILFQPRVADHKGDRITLRSPTGQEAFDAITDISDQVQLRVAPKSNGFEAVLTMPLSLLNFTPVSGKQIKADLGYIFGNASGTQAMIRAYWINNGFTANVVDDIPHESRLEPNAWGEAQIE